MHIEKDASGWPVIEIEFRFIRYRLVVDDQKFGEQLRSLLDIVLSPKSRVVGEKLEMPRFYKKGVEKKK